MFWVAWNTDNGLECGEGWPDQGGLPCRLYDVPLVMVEVAAVVALVSFVVSSVLLARGRS